MVIVDLLATREGVQKMSGATGRERFLQNYHEISRFCRMRDYLPRRRNVILGIADLLHNYKRDPVISDLARRNAEIKRFFRAHLNKPSDREKIFHENSALIRLAAVHLLNTKLKEDPLREKDDTFYLEEEEEEEKWRKQKN